MNTLIIIHELGHCISAKLFNVEVDKIYIFPLGGITKLNMELNINPIKEFFILIAGPIFQNIAYLLLVLLFNKDLVLKYHIGIILFNLLPIYPLDGGKIIELFFEKYIPYKKALKLSAFVSYLFIIILFIKSNNIKLNVLVTITLLLLLVLKEHKKINYKYNKFKLERYLNNYKFKKSRIITNENDLYRNNRHLLKINDKYYLESEYFAKKIKKNTNLY